MASPKLRLALLALLCCVGLCLLTVVAAQGEQLGGPALGPCESPAGGPGFDCCGAARSWRKGLGDRTRKGSRRPAVFGAQLSWCWQCWAGGRAAGGISRKGSRLWRRGLGRCLHNRLLLLCCAAAERGDGVAETLHAFAAQDLAFHG